MSFKKYTPPRTFWDLLQYHAAGETHNCCSFCKEAGSKKVLYQYSTRHYICASCIIPRRDVVLPRVRKHEAFMKKLDALKKGAV